MDPVAQTIEMLRRNLALGARADAFNADTALMGSLPEFDSMAVVGLVTAIEDELGCEVDDEEITAEVFETVGTLAAFVESKLE
jgi:acyl carrier protein